MKKTKNNLNEARDLAVNAASSISQLWEILGKPARINQYAQTNFLNLCDELNNIKHELIGRTDGRPSPLDFSADFDSSLKSVVACEDKERIEQKKLEFSKWAECYGSGKGYKQVASIACRDFTLQELRALRAWIDEVLAFHGKKPSR